MVNIVGIDFESIVDGEGVRVVVFFSGCKHNCKGCHNPASHSFTAGRPFTDELQHQIIEYIKVTPYISGVTLSGGDPMFSPVDVLRFVELLRSEIPRINIWIYTGFVFYQILDDRDRSTLLSNCDVLVDGKFIMEQRDTTLLYRGSRNQRIIDIQKSKTSSSGDGGMEVVLWRNA